MLRNRLRGWSIATSSTLRFEPGRPVKTVAGLETLCLREGLEVDHGDEVLPRERDRGEFAEDRQRLRRHLAGRDARAATTRSNAIPVVILNLIARSFRQMRIKTLMTRPGEDDPRRFDILWGRRSSFRIDSSRARLKHIGL